MKNLSELIRKEFTLELRRKSVITGLALYLFSTVFICYLTFALGQNLMSALVWGSLFWISVLFAGINSIAKSFIGERKGKDIYYYSIAAPQQVILSKIVYNSLLSTLLALAGLILFVLFLGNPIADLFTFLLIILLASWGFSSSLTLLSGIAAKASSSNILMAVLSFPVIISILLIAIKATKNCIDGLEFAASADEILTLLAINCLATAVSYLLFPYIWRT